MPWNLNITQVGLNSKPEAWWNCWTFNLTCLHEEWIFGKSFAQRFWVVSVCILSDIQIKYIFWLLQYFQEETLHQHWKLVSEAWRTALGFGAVKCFIAVKWTRLPLCFSQIQQNWCSEWHRHWSVTRSEKKTLPKTSHLPCMVSGCSGQEHYVENNAVKGGAGRPPLKCINVRSLSTKQCLSMWSRAFKTQECCACASCEPSLVPSLNCQYLALVSQIPMARGHVHIKAL